MSHVIYDWFYFDKASMKNSWLEEMRGELVQTPHSDYKEQEPLYLFKETKETFAVPRGYGISKASQWKLPMNNQSLGNGIIWPDIKIDSWRRGQEKAIDETIKHLKASLGGLLSAPVGSGKSLMAADIARRLGQKTLVLTHKEDLAEMWHESCKKFYPGIKLGHVQQSVWEYKDKHLVTALYQTIHRRGDVLDKKFREQFGLIIAEEGHRIAAPTFANVISKFPARYRLGISATWRRKDEMDCLFYWLIGGVAHRMTVDTLKCFYFQPQFRLPFSDNAFKGWGGSLNTSKLITTISEYESYNDYLATQVDRAVASGRKVLVVTDRLKQVEILMQKIKSSSGKYVGETDKVGREITRKLPVIIGTYAAIGEGTDIPELDTLVMATPRSDIAQVVGRIRRPHHSKKVPVILDPVLSLGYTRALAQKRLIQYNNLGFEEMK